MATCDDGDDDAEEEEEDDDVDDDNEEEEVEEEVEVEVEVEAEPAWGCGGTAARLGVCGAALGSVPTTIEVPSRSGGMCGTDD